MTLHDDHDGNHEHDNVDRRDAILATLLEAQARHVVHRRRRRRAASLGAAALLLVAGAVVIRALLITGTPVGPADGLAPPHTTIANDDRSSTAVEIDLPRARIDRVGGSAPRWVAVGASDPTIIERLRVRSDARPDIADDAALMRHLAAAGRNDGLVRIGDTVMLVSHARQ